MTIALQTIPPALVMATTDTLPITFDTSPLLRVGETPSAYSATLLDTTSGKDVALSDPATLAGNVIEQIIRGSELIAKHVYIITWIFTAAVDTVWTEVTQLNVPI